MGGIGLSSTEPQPNPSRTYIRTDIHTHIHISAYTCTHIHAQRTIQYSSPQHLVEHRTEYRIQHNRYTQHAHNMHTHNTENSTYTSTQDNTLAAHSYEHIVLILCLSVYIKKLYNTAMYKLYTFCSPYWWGEQNKIDISKNSIQSK